MTRRVEVTTDKLNFEALYQSDFEGYVQADKGLLTEAVASWCERAQAHNQTHGAVSLSAVTEMHSLLSTPIQRIAFWRTVSQLPVTAVYFQPAHAAALLAKVRESATTGSVVLLAALDEIFALTGQGESVSGEEMQLRLEQAALLAGLGDADKIKRLFSQFFKKVKPLITDPQDLTRLITFAQQLQAQAKADPAMLTDFLCDAEKTYKADPLTFLSAVLLLATTSASTARVNTRRVFQLLGEGKTKVSADTLVVVAELVGSGIYPTPTVLEKAVALANKPDRELLIGEFVAVSERIRQQEVVNVADPVELDMYYNYLKVPIPFATFVEILREVPASKLGKKAAKFTPFRISAQGVKAITNNTDPALVEPLRAEIISHSQVATAKQFLQAIPGLPKKVLSKAAKDELMRAVALTLTDNLSKAGKLNAVGESPFNDTNVLGKTEKLLLLPASYQKITHLQYAHFQLGQFIKASQKLVREGKFIAAEQALIKKNIARAEELRTACSKVTYIDLEVVLKDFDSDPENYKHLDALCECYSQLDLFTDQNEAEAKITAKLAQSIFTAAFHHIHDIGVADAQHLLSVSAHYLFAARLDGSESQQVLWECLELKALLATPDMADQVSEGRADVVLESSKDLYAEKIPEQFNQVLAGQAEEDGLWHIGKKINDQFDTFAVEEAQGIMKKVESLFQGNAAYLKSSSKNEALVTTFGGLVTLMMGRLAKIEKEFTETHPGIARNYHVDAIGHLIGSLRYVTAGNRDLNKILAIPGLTDKERKVVEALKAKLLLFVEILRPLQSSLQAVDNSGLKKVDRQETLAEIKDKVSKLADAQQKSYDAYPAYIAFGLARDQLMLEWQTTKETGKDSLYAAYLAETNGVYDAAVFQPRLRAATKEIDALFSARLKLLRRQYEQNNPDVVQVVDQIEKITDRLHRLAQALDPISAIQKDKLRPVQAELAKISYEDLGDDDFELVPSKATGDIFKGWISDDCSTNAGYRKHIASPSFINYRVYKKQDGERTWVGNVYVLDVMVSGQPVLILDAIQVSRSTSVNPKSFLKGVLAGMGGIADKNHYRYIISNKITDAAGGYLVSNRTQLRQAYMMLYDVCQTMQLDERSISGIDSERHPFQSLTQGDGEFKVLWQHPEVRPAISLVDLVSWASDHAGTAFGDALRQKEKKNSFVFGLVFQTTSAVATLHSFAVNPDQLRFYLQLMLDHFEDSAVHTALANPLGLALVYRFHQLQSTFAPIVVRPLVDLPNSHAVLAGMAEIGEESPAGRAFLAKLLANGLFFPKEQLLLIQRLAIEYNKLGLEHLLFQTFERGHKPNYSHLSRIGEFIGRSADTETNRKLIPLMVNYPLVGIDLDQCLGLLNRIYLLNPAADAVGPALSVGQVLLWLHDHRLPSLAILDNVVTLTEEGGANKANYLVYAARLIRDGLLVSLGQITQLLTDLAKLDNLVMQVSDRLSSELLSGHDVLDLCRQQPDQIGNLKGLLAALSTSTAVSPKLAFAKQFVQKRASFVRAAMVCAAPDQLLDVHYFFIYNLDDNDLQPGDSLAQMEAKFLAKKVDGSALKGRQSLKHLVISGRDYALTGEQYQKALAAQFDIFTLSQAPRAQQGESARLRRAEADEAIPTGYSGIADFIDDQPSVYSLEFHK